MAASLTGTGYIDITYPSGTFVPESDVFASRFLWYPGKMAFRFGASDSNWNDGAIGYGSFAGGQALASGFGAFAFGPGDNYGTVTTASGDYSLAFYGSALAADSIAIGQMAYSGGAGSIVIGAGAYGGDEVGSEGTVVIGPGAQQGSGGAGSSVVIGKGASTGYYGSGVVIGVYASGTGVVIGENSHSDYGLGTAVGFSAEASYGGGGTALGQEARATGMQATALGSFSEALADYTIAVGTGSLVYAPGGVAIGNYNSIKGKNGVTGATDSNAPLFAIGNGSSDTARANAFTIYRDGDIHATKAIRVPKQGDISMGIYTAKPPGVVFP